MQMPPAAFHRGKYSNYVGHEHNIINHISRHTVERHSNAGVVVIREVCGSEHVESD